jgi:hypothetical protein
MHPQTRYSNSLMTASATSRLLSLCWPPLFPPARSTGMVEPMAPSCGCLARLLLSPFSAQVLLQGVEEEVSRLAEVIARTGPAGKALREGEQAVQRRERHLREVEERRKGLQVRVRELVGQRGKAVARADELQADVARLERSARYLELVERFAVAMEECDQFLRAALLGDCLLAVPVECKQLHAEINRELHGAVLALRPKLEAELETALKTADWPRPAALPRRLIDGGDASVAEFLAAPVPLAGAAGAGRLSGAGGMSGVGIAGDSVGGAAIGGTSVGLACAGGVSVGSAGVGVGMDVVAERWQGLCWGIARLTVLQVLWEETLPESGRDADEGIAAGRLWVVDCMEQALGVRFRFHFQGTRRTNRADKPEWFFSYQVLSLVTSRGEGQH